MRPFQVMKMGSAGGTSLDTQTITVGGGGVAVEQNRIRGFYLGTSGSISDGSSNLYGGATITALAWNEGSGGTAFYTLAIAGATNTGWTQVVINSSKVLLRSAASFSSGTWTWTTADNVVSQAFGIPDSVRTCVFT